MNADLIDAVLLMVARGQVPDACRAIETAFQGDPSAAAGLIADIGGSLSERGDHQDAVGLLEHAVGLAEQGDANQLAIMLGNLGNAYTECGRYERAINAFRRAAELYAKCGDPTWRLMMLINLGNALDYLGQADSAIAQYRDVATLAAEFGLKAQQSLAVYNIGNVHGKRRAFQEAREAHAAALALAWEAEEAQLIESTARHLALDLRSLHDSGQVEAESLANKAAQAWAAGQHALAQAGISAALNLVDAQLAPIQLAGYLDCQSTFYAATSRTAAAIDSEERAVALARQCGDARLLADFLVNLSSRYIRAGRLLEAARAASEAFTVAKKADHPPAASRGLGNLGIAHHRLGDYSAAELYLQRQHKLALEIGDEPQAANASNTLGALFSELGQLDRATWAFEQARALATKHGLGVVEASASINLGILEKRKSNGKLAAKELFRNTIARCIELDNADGHLDAATNLIRLLTEEDELDEAQALVQSIGDLVATLGDPQSRGILSELKAEIARKERRFEAAREEFQAAAAAFVHSEPTRAATCFVESAAIAYQEFREAEQAGALGPPEDAQTLLGSISVEVMRAVRIFEQVATKLEDHALWGLVQRQEKAFRLLLELTLRLAGYGAGLAAAERGRGRALRIAMHRRLAGHRTSAFHSARTIGSVTFETVTHMAANGSNFAALNPAVLEALSRSVQRKEPLVPELGQEELVRIGTGMNATVVEFAFGANRERLYVWVIADGLIRFDELDLAPIGGVPGLDEAVTTLHERVGLVRDLEPGVATERVDCSGLLRKLYDALIRPIEHWLPTPIGAPVCIVPDGPLFEVPFSALLGRDDRAVLDRWAFFSVPALHFYAVPREESPTGFVIAGDPVLSPSVESEWGRIRPLPAARREAEEVASIYGAQALIGEAASKASIRPALAHARLIHLAAHGAISQTRPLDSAILLAAGDEDDGLLRVRDIDKETLSASLVVLSCCSTAQGRVTGDGTLSLCRGMLAAGAQTVVASLWAVDDDSTSFTMTDFHRRVASNSAESLASMFRESQLATRARYPHHSQWAPFVLWGWHDGNGSLTGDRQDGR